MAGWLEPMVTGAASSFFKGVGAQGGQRLAGAAVDKVLGIPNPQPKTGAALGADMKAYQDQAFPGTNPWERLGTSYPGGSVEAAKQSGKVQKEMQSKELATRVQVADIGAQAHVQAAATSIGPKAVQSAVGTQQGRGTAPYKTETQSRIPLLDQQKLTEVKKTLLTGSDADIKKAQAYYAKELARYAVTAEKHRTLLASLENAIKDKDITSGTAIAVAKGGALIVGATVIGRFIKGVASMIPFFRKVPLAEKIGKRIQAPKKAGGLKEWRKRPPPKTRHQMNPQKPPPPAPKYPGKGKLSKKATKRKR